MWLRLQRLNPGLDHILRRKCLPVSPQILQLLYLNLVIYRGSWWTVSFHCSWSGYKLNAKWSLAKVQSGRHLCARLHKLRLDRKRWARWAPQNHIQNQGKDAWDTMSLRATQIFHTMWIKRCSIHCLQRLIAWSWKTDLSRWHQVTLCRDSQTALRFSRCRWRHERCRICWTYTESDMAVRATAAVCEYHGAPTTRVLHHGIMLWRQTQGC